MSDEDILYELKEFHQWKLDREQQEVYNCFTRVMQSILVFYCPIKFDVSSVDYLFSGRKRFRSHHQIAAEIQYPEIVARKRYRRLGVLLVIFHSIFLKSLSFTLSQFIHDYAFFEDRSYRGSLLCQVKIALW